VTFDQNVKLTLPTGDDCASLGGDEKSQKAIASTCAKAMGVSESDVSYVGCKTATTSRNMRSKSLATASVEVTTKAVVSTKATPQFSTGKEL